MLITVSLTAILIAVSTRSREPHYGGKSLSEWLVAFKSNGVGSLDEVPNATAAVRAMGANAVLPSLIEMLQAEDSKLKLRFVQLCDDHQLWIICPMSAMEKHHRAASAVAALGRSGEPAVPVLTTLLESGNLWDSWLAADALAEIGGPAIPPLLKLARHGTRDEQSLAYAALGKTLGENQRVVPELERCLSHSDETVRVSAACSLSKLGECPELVIPILNALLSITNSNHYSAVVGLGNYGPRAKEAVPNLVAALNDRYANTRAEATNALIKIDPVTATRYGLK